MLSTPMSSPQITRMFGFFPSGVAVPRFAVRARFWAKADDTVRATTRTTATTCKDSHEFVAFTTTPPR